MFSIRDSRKALIASLTMSMVATIASHAKSNSFTDGQLDEIALNAVPLLPTRDLCDEAPPGYKRCFAKLVGTQEGNFEPFSNPQGFGPADLRSAYGLPTSGGGGRLVAIVDAQDAPNAESGLAAYRAQFGLPPCTTANGCFKKVNQNGVQGSYPASNSGWAGEIALDIQMVSAVCPDCKILLVEANSSSNADLGAAVNTAASMGAVAISNSYGGSEDSSTSSDDTHYYNHPGILITASSGDNAFAAGASSPASGAHVLSVGGTTLAKSTSTRGWGEKAWRSGGSGCSRYITKPSFQADTGCTKRMVADVSAVGDPNTGVAVYDGGWQVIGGTSASSPIVAAIFTLLNLQGQTNQFPYANPTAFFDVTSGTNGSCSPAYFCTSATGYDGPTGVGTPNGALLATLGGGTPPPPPQPDAGTSPPQADSGAPPQTDSGIVGTTDASVGGNDSGTATHDSGTGAHDSGGATEGDSSTHGGSDSGSDDPSNSDNWPSQASNGCACSTQDATSRGPDAGFALFAIGALVVSLRRRKTGDRPRA